MTREYCLKVAKLKGFDFDTARELITFIAPRRRFDGIVAAWREYLQWKYAGADTNRRPYQDRYKGPLILSAKEFSIT